VSSTSDPARSGGRASRGRSRRRRAATVLGAGLVASLLALHLTGGAEETASQQLDRLLAEAWDFELREDPLFATRVGDHRFDHRLPSVQPEDFSRRRERLEGFLARLGAVDRTVLARREQVSYDIFRRLTETRIAEIRFRSHQMPWNGASGFHTELPRLPDITPFDSVAAYERYVSRLGEVGRYFDEQIAQMRAGLEARRVLPRAILDGWEGQIDPHLVDDPTKSLFYAPFEDFPAAVPESDRPRLAAAGRRAVETSVVPAYRRLRTFLADAYVPGARDTVAAGALPDGAAFYGHRVRRFTTLDLTPDEVHRTGRAEVARIRREMEAVIDEVGFAGDFHAFVDFLRTDPRFYAESPEELLQEVSWVLKRMDGKLPELFASLPRMPYGVKPVPDFLAPKIYTAYYEAPAGDGTRAGYYNVNTYDLPSRPLYEIEALSFHEAIPGHHLQIALQQEIEDLPALRKFRRFEAFQEGWALYAERLGLEVGFYQDPYRNFGRLTYEMWRALRLVVDTGLHAFGWSRQQAIDYMAEHSALSVHNITTEVDRYIGWPGQALAYKTGELEIRELRARAEEALGPRFDLREFHDVVLREGAVPLTVLEQQVEAWLASYGDEAATPGTPETPGETPGATGSARQPATKRSSRSR